MKFLFTHPNYLYLLFFIPIVVFFHFVALRLHKSRALKFANFEAIARIKGIDLFSRNIATLLATISLFITIILALTGLQVEYTSKLSSYSFVVAIDASRSMEAKDFSPTRFDAAKESALSFVDMLPSGTPVGVVSFSGNSFIEQPVTQDVSLVKYAIRRIGLSEVGGTDINEAIVTAVNMLESHETKSLVILSDGQINVGTIESGIAYAKKNQLTIHTIALGTSEGGETSYGLSKVDEESLRALSYNTEGSSARASETTDLLNAFQDIAKVKEGIVKKDISSWLLILALVLLSFLYFLMNVRYRLFP